MSADTAIPRVGMLATLRNRRGLVVSVEPFDPPELSAASTEGRLHLVRVEYTDSDGAPDDTVVWEREHGRELLEPHALPEVETRPPMRAPELDALVRATRWSALTPFVHAADPAERSELPIAAPFFGAVQVDDFQLVPLLKALQMPRVSLLLADDVGLGKTIEAGLILTELLLRRRVRRVLVISPASLRLQWQQEMKDKFALGFDVIDRHETYQLRKRLGMDANPWRTFPRIITSYHYLRQPDVLEQFMATCRPAGTDPAQVQAQLPWDLLIVDEAHNLMPANFGADSDLSRMLRAISPYFEHKLFLTATPHNGHTRCFSGLLEQLDPVRFTQTSDFTDDEKKRVEDVVVRRLKREINELDDQAGRPRRFATRHLEPVPLYFGKHEKALSRAFAAFRAAVKACIKNSRNSEQRAGTFAIEVLNKRLLSCPYTFAESWYRFKQGLEGDESADAGEVSAAQRASEEEIDDDQEREGRARHAARTVGAWLHPFIDQLADQVAGVDQALANLGIVPRTDSGPGPSTEPNPDEPALTDPIHDQRLERIIELIHKELRTPRGWRDDERLIVFTEYKTTLDYLERRLAAAFHDRGTAIRVLYGGGMLQKDRDALKVAFNDPAADVRVLIATDAASEGLNLQETARLLLHYEIPWNPSRLEQRNGRLDRHGQARDVFVHHFASEDDADLDFIAHVVGKVHDIREDLGSVGELFDAAFQRRFIDQEDAERIKQSLDHDVAASRDATVVPRHRPTTTGADEAERLQALCHDIDLDAGTLCHTLEVALGIGVGLPRLSGPDARGYMQLVKPIPPRWEPLIDDTLRLPGQASLGALPGLVFDPALFMHDSGGRPVFRPARDAVLLHLGHPMFRHALATFARARFPGGHEAFDASRWTVRRGPVPAGADALILLTIEELAINELREPFHHWARTLRLPVQGGRLGPAQPYAPPARDRVSAQPVTAADIAAARDIWLEVQYDIKPVLAGHAEHLSRTVRDHLRAAGKQAQKEQKTRFTHRLKEVERAMRETTIARLERERKKLLDRKQQGVLFEDITRKLEAELRDLDDEIRRRKSRYQELLDQLGTEQTRVLEHLLPRRYALRGDAQVFPVAVEIRLPQTPQKGSR